MICETRPVLASPTPEQSMLKSTGKSRRVPRGLTLLLRVDTIRPKRWSALGMPSRLAPLCFRTRKSPALLAGLFVCSALILFQEFWLRG